MRWGGVLFVLLAHSSLSFCAYQLVWSDEFNGPLVDTSKWDYEVNCWGGGNLEKQCYINSVETLSIQNGKLVFHPVYHPGGYQGKRDGCTDDNEGSCTWIQPVTSARIRTLKSQSWSGGRFEFRARLPVGNFLRPSIWLLPAQNIYGQWAASGEIDIVEFRGQPSQANILEQIVHYGGAWPNNTHTGTGKKSFKQNFTEDFHLFDLIWTHEKLSWFVDNIKTYELPLNRSWWNGKGVNPYTGPFQPFDQPFYILLNLAIAGSFFSPDEFGVFNASQDSKTWIQTREFEIDYVRVFQDVYPLPSSPILSDWVIALIALGSLFGLLIIVKISTSIWLECRKREYSEVIDVN